MASENDNYLNLPGLSHFFDKLKTLFATKNELKNIKGDKGDPGVQGVSITKVEQTVKSTSDGGTNTITVTLSDGATSTFNVKNGSKGSTGAKGDTGEKGDKGDKGDTGNTGAKGATGTRGSRWTAGTAITGTSTTATAFSDSGITDALVNDMYLNTSTGYVYRCTTSGAASTAKWVYTGSIKGATGAQGTNATTTSVATTSANGLMSKDMVTRLNLCTSELIQSSEPTTQNTGDSWLQEYN